MTDDQVKRFLRNYKTGTDNNGRKALAGILADYDNPKVLDAACGTAVNYEVLAANNIPVQYTGMDRTIKFINYAKELYGDNITMVEGYVQEMPFQDNEFDVVILRHILEHLEDYELAVREAIRVAKKEVIIVFFLDPSNDLQDQIEVRKTEYEGYTYWWNTYSWPKFVRFVSEFGLLPQRCVFETPGAAHRDTIVRLKK